MIQPWQWCQSRLRRRSRSGGAGARGLAAAVLFAPWALGAPGPASASAVPQAGPPSRFAPVPGPFAVEAMNLDWLDQARNRPVPVRIYFPRHEPGPFPVVIFSPGLGAGRASLEFLGRHLASHGYISVHIQHPGTDDQAQKDGAGGRQRLLEAVRDPATGLTRLLDLVFALDQVGALAASSPVLRGRVDLKAVAVGGSNLGAWTALAAAGLAVTGKDGEESSLPDPRVKAALLFAPPPAVGPQRDKLHFEHVKVPCLHIVGAPAGREGGGGEAATGGGRFGGRNGVVRGGAENAQWAARRVAFDRIAGVDQVLVTVTAVPGTPGDRAAAAPGRGAGGVAPARDAALQDPIKAISTAFLDAHLRHDAAARDWLTGGGLVAWLGDKYRVETRSR